MEIIEADYHDEKHASDILYMTDVYARDPMGAGEPLPNATRVKLMEMLKDMPNALSFIAYADGEVAGLANCFVGLSTFRAQKIINIHDIVVIPDKRGLGIGEKLLKTVQKKAKELNCSMLTLEVREDNPARDLYERFGFENDPPKMWFMVKDLY